MWEELSFETDLQTMSLRTASDVIKHFKPIMKMMTGTDDMLGTANRPHFGLSLQGHETVRQQHAPLDVLHVASGQKLCRFWPPAFHPKETPNVVCAANWGDMVWIPPGWDHETITLEGQVHGEEDNVMCVH